ncbi:MAG TPA: DUF6607 family protein [Arachidicoccus sp.]
MVKKIIFAAFVASIALPVFAQTKPEKKAIKDLCGCFAVRFNYAETFTGDTIHKKFAHPLDTNSVFEYEYPIEQSPKKVVIQHILIVPGYAVIKHWREDWEYEKKVLWKYDKDKVWTKIALNPSSVKGQWMQSVWEVDDAPRYQGSSEWIKTDRRLMWINTADAPLPRREYTTRHDYNVMNRESRFAVSDSGYLYEEDNKKIIRKDGAPDSLLAQEKGYNQYVHVPQSNCEKALAFWTKEKADFWKDVRANWEEKMNIGTEIKLKTKVNGKFLYEALDDVETKHLTGGDRKKAINDLINQYIEVNVVS